MKRPIIGTMRLGSWGANFAPADMAGFLRGCVDAGASEVDLSDVYGDYTTNKLVGSALAHDPTLRRHLRLIAKIGISRRCAARSGQRVHYYDSSRDALTHAIEQTFVDLGVNHLDMLMLHRFDYLTEPDSVAEVIQPLLATGRISAFGVSNFDLGPLELLASYLPIAAHQIRLSLADTSPLDTGVLAWCLRRSCEVMAWGPLDAGMLLQDDHPVAQQLRPVADRLATAYDAELAQLYLSWIYRLPGLTTPVIGTHRVERVAKAVAAARIPLGHEAWYELLEAARGHSVA